MPIFNLAPELMRVRVGLDSADTSKDAEIDAALIIAKDIIEDYLDRKLEYAVETEAFIHENGATLSLIRYPIDSIGSIAGTTGYAVNAYHVNKNNGLVFLDGHYRAHEMTVTYTGGYQTLPGALEMALLSVFDRVYGNLFDVGNISVNDAIKTIKAGDLSITYEGATTLYTNATEGMPVNEFLQPNIIGLLSLYRRENT